MAGDFIPPGTHGRQPFSPVFPGLDIR